MNSSRLVLLVTLLLLGFAKTKGLKGTTKQQNRIASEFPKTSTKKQRRAQEKDVAEDKTKTTTAPAAPPVTGAPTAEPSVKPTAHDNVPNSDEVQSFLMTLPLTPFHVDYTTTSEAENLENMADVLTTYLEERMFAESVIVSVKKITLVEYEGNIFTGSILLEESEKFRNWKADVKGQQQLHLIDQMYSLEQELILKLQDISLTVDVSFLQGKVLDLKPFSIEFSDQASEPAVTYALSIFLISYMYQGNATRRHVQEVKTLAHPLMISVNLTASPRDTLSSKFDYDGAVELYLSDALEQKGKIHWESSLQKEEEYWLVTMQEDLKSALLEHAVTGNTSALPSLVDIILHSDNSTSPTSDGDPKSASPTTPDQEVDPSQTADSQPTAPAWESSIWLKGVMGGIVIGAVGIAGALLYARKKYARPTGRKARRGSRTDKANKVAQSTTVA